MHTIISEVNHSIFCVFFYFLFRGGWKLRNRHLANNISYLCRKYGGIGKVARAVSINRTQLSKYANAMSVPRAVALEKLCNFFEVSEYEIFLTDLASKDQNFQKNAWLNNSDFNKIFDHALASRQPDLAEGFYITYFFCLDDNAMVIRSITVVRMVDGLMTFSRITGANEPMRSKWKYSIGRHDGVVLQRRNHIHFLGFNRKAENIPTLISTQFAHSGRPLIVGNASIITPKGPTSWRVVLEFTSNQDLTLRERISMTNSLDIHDALIPSDVRIHLLEAQG